MRARRGFIARIVLTATLVSACGPAPFVPSAEPMSAEQALQAALARPEAWPALPPDPAFIAASRRTCFRDLAVDPNLPFVLEDRREPGTATVLFADAKAVAWCGMRRTPEGILPDGGAGTQARWKPDIGVVADERGFTISTSTAAGSWATLLGLVPAGAARVRAVVGGRPVDAVIGGGMYSVSWPQGVSPTALVAYDAARRELTRIDARKLAGLFGCAGQALGCTPPPP